MSQLEDNEADTVASTTTGEIEDESEEGTATTTPEVEGVSTTTDDIDDDIATSTVSEETIEDASGDTGNSGNTEDVGQGNR